MGDCPHREVESSGSPHREASSRADRESDIDQWNLSFTVCPRFGRELVLERGLCNMLRQNQGCVMMRPSTCCRFYTLTCYAPSRSGSSCALFGNSCTRRLYSLAMQKEQPQHMLAHFSSTALLEVIDCGSLLFVVVMQYEDVLGRCHRAMANG